MEEKLLKINITIISKTWKNCDDAERTGKRLRVVTG